MNIVTRKPFTQRPKSTGQTSRKEYRGDFEQGLVYFMPNLKAFACSLTRDVTHAEDLVQDTVLRALNNKEKFIRGSNLLAWLFTILRNLFLSELRRNKSFADIVPQIQTRGKSNEASSQHNHMQLMELLHAVDKLPSHQKRAVTMVGALGYSYEETAKYEACAIGTVKSRVSRARSALQEWADPDSL